MNHSVKLERVFFWHFWIKVTKGNKRTKPKEKKRAKMREGESEVKLEIVRERGERTTMRVL